MELSIAQIIGKPIAVLDIDGRKVYEQIEAAYKRGERIILSFKGLQHVTTAFLNAAIGKFLLNALKPEEAISAVTIQDITDNSTQYKIDQVYELALKPELRKIQETARNEELGINE